MPVVAEPPQAQAIYPILDGVMSAVLTQQNANIEKLLTTRERKDPDPAQRGFLIDGAGAGSAGPRTALPSRCSA